MACLCDYGTKTEKFVFWCVNVCVGDVSLGGEVFVDLGITLTLFALQSGTVILPCVFLYVFGTWLGVMCVSAEAM